MIKIPGQVEIRAYKIEKNACSFTGRILEKHLEGTQPFSLDQKSIKKYLIAKFGRMKTKDNKILAFKVMVWGGAHPRSLFPNDENGKKQRLLPYGIINPAAYAAAERYVMAKSVKKTLMR